MSQKQGSISAAGLIASSLTIAGISAFLLKPATSVSTNFDLQSISSVDQRISIELAKKSRNEPHKANYLLALKERLHLQSFPYDKPDASALGKAIEQAQLMPQTKFGATPAARKAGEVGIRAIEVNPLAEWENIGPKNLSVPYNIYYGPPGSSIAGRVGGLAFDPADSSIMYLGAAAGGVWKTVDSGTTWTPLGNGFAAPYVGSLAVSPFDSNVIIAGLGDRDGGAGFGDGVLRSEDGGTTWTKIVLRNGTAVSKVLFDPEDANLVFVAMQDGGGLFKSTDGGRSFGQVIIDGSAFPQCANLAIGARDEAGNRHYTVRVVGRGLYYSADKGDTWTQVSEPGDSGASRNHVDASPINFGRLYYSDANSESIYQGDFDGTDYQWTDITTNLPNDGYNWSQSWYDHHITVATHLKNGVPQDYVYVGLITIAVWDGSKWTNIGQTYTEDSKTHNDQHCMAVSPSNSNRVVIGNDGGVWPIEFNPEKQRWSIEKNSSRTIPMAMFYDADWHPRDAFRMIGGTQDNASPVAAGNLANWINRTGGDGGGCSINPLNPKVAYGSSQFNGLYRTSDGWNTQSGFGPPDDFAGDRIPFITRMSIDPSFPNPLYVHTNFLSRFNANGTWNRRLGNTNLCPNGGTILTSSVAPSDSKVIYVGGGNGNFWRSGDAGATWRRLDNIASLAWSARPVTSISVHPTNPNDVLVSFGGGSTAVPRVIRIANTSATNPTRTNASGTGITALPNILTSAITRDNVDPVNKFYVANDVGVFRTADGGTTWENFGQPLGLPICEVKDIMWVPGTGYLNIATYGRGMWRLKLLDVREDQRPAVRFFSGLRRYGTYAGGTITIENGGTMLVNDLKINNAELTISTGPTKLRTTMPIDIGTVNFVLNRSFELAFTVRNRPNATGTIAISGTYRLNDGRTIPFTDTQPILLP